MKIWLNWGQRSGWPTWTSDDLKTLCFKSYSWCISKETWAPQDIICDKLRTLQPPTLEKSKHYNCLEDRRAAYQMKAYDKANSGSWEVIWTAKGLSHIMSFGGQHFLNSSCICSKTQSLRSSKVNLGQPEVSHLTSHLSEHVFIVILLSLAFNWYATCLYSVDFQFFIFQGPKRSREVSLRSVIWPLTCLDRFSS